LDAAFLNGLNWTFDGDENIRTRRVLHAVRRPHDLESAVYFSDLHHLGPGIVGKKTDAVGWMPVLGEINRQSRLQKLPGGSFDRPNILDVCAGNG